MYACDANCASCHPVLIKDGKYDDNHRILKNCINCHQPNDDDHGSCGADCWDCHDVNKVAEIDITEHRVLKQCIECHTSIQKQFLNGEMNDGSKNMFSDKFDMGNTEKDVNTLKDFLLKTSK